MAKRSGDNPYALQIGYIARPPSAATNVAAELDWRANHNGNIVVIATLDDLDVYFPSVGGARTITGIVEITGALTLPDGDYFMFAGGCIRGPGVLATALILGNVAGGLFRGPVCLSDAVVLNINPSGSDFDINDALGQNVTLSTILSLGADAGTIANCFGVVSLEDVVITGAVKGFELDGTIVAIDFERCSFANTVAVGFIAYDVLSTCTIVVQAAWSNCRALTQLASQYLVRVSTSATVPTAAPPTTVIGLFITGCFSSGPGGLLDEGAGNIPTSDLRMYARNNRGLQPSAIEASAAFSDVANPVTIAYGAINTPTRIPYIGAGASPLATTGANERWSLILDDPNPGDWYLRYNGTESGITLVVGATCSMESVSTVQDFELLIRYDPDGLSGYTTISIVQPTEQQNRATQQVVNGGVRDVSPGARITLNGSVLGGPTNTLVYAYTISARSSQ